MHKFFNDSQIRSMFFDTNKAFDRFCTKVLREAIAENFARYGSKVLYAA